MRYLIFYCYYEKSKDSQNNLQYFLNNGIYDEYDYVFILNNACGITIQSKNNITIVKRQHVGNDFHAYAHIINCINNLQEYDYFFFINSNVCGPFLPKYCNNKLKWTDIYTDLLKNNVKLVGSSIIISNTHNEKTIDFRTRYNYLLPYAYVNIDTFALDKEGFEFVKEKIFSQQIPDVPDILMSQMILRRGWNISCCLPEYQNIDYKFLKFDINNTSIDGDPNHLNAYFGNTLHKYELIFTKKSVQVLKPKNTNILVNILYHDQASLEECTHMKKYNWVNLAFLETTKYFESNYIHEFKKTVDSWKNYDYVGMITYSFRTKFCNYDIQNLANLHHDCDAITLNNYTSLPLVKHGEFCHPNFVPIWTQTLKLLGYTESQYMSQAIPTFVNNYWIVKPTILIEYIQFFDKIINIFETNDDIKKLLYEDSKYIGNVSKEKLLLITGKPYYAHHPFMMERFICFFLWINNYKVYYANQKIDKLLD
jgi:hypothetical protein